MSSPDDATAAEEKRLRGGVKQFFLTTKHALAWHDVVGNEAARNALVEAIEQPVKHADLYAHYGRRASKGVLLYGPPGCGKTMFGKAAASILAQLHGRDADGCTMLSLKGPEIRSIWHGETEATIRRIYAYARAYRARYGFPLVIFIDEADSILPARDGGGTSRLDESIVATFLAEMDGLDECAAFTILATNRPDAIDAAILRDGRCDRKIKVERPNRAAAEAILVKALAGVPVAPDPEPIAPEATRALLAARAADMFFAAERVLKAFSSDKGPRALTLGDIVSGAMLVGLIEKAKAAAFARDLAAGGPPSGLKAVDLDAAIATVLAENRGLNHWAALAELGERDGLSSLVPVPLETLPDGPPRYGLDDGGNVVRLQ